MTRRVGLFLVPFAGILCLSLCVTACTAPGRAPSPASHAGSSPDDYEEPTTMEEALAEVRRLRQALGEERKLRMRSGSHDYRIGPGDELDVSVWKNPELSRRIAVGPGGTISLPLLNQVPAAGRTPDELREELLDRYAEYIPAPEVSVLVTTVRSLTISVIGEVKSPGRYTLPGPTTILEALAMAGGLSQFASSDIVVLRPNGEGGTNRLTFDYDDALSSAGADQNFYLQAGDIVVIP